MEIWSPHNITAICAQAQAPLVQCSPVGFMYLSLVMQLYGHTSYSTSYAGADRYPSQIITADTPPKTPATLAIKYLRNIGPQSTASSGQQNTFSNFNSPASATVNFDTGYDSQQDPRFSEDVTNAKDHAPEYDFIIVGAGSAGCVLAHRLSEIKHWRILLLEAGPEEPDITLVPAFPPLLRQSSIDWDFKTEPEELMCRAYPGGVCVWPRGKTMGGSSAINYLIYIRGNKLDYDEWAEMGNEGWSYDEILPYFKKAENNRDIEGKDTKYHGVGGPLNVERYPYIGSNAHLLVEAFQERGLPLKDLNLPDNLGVNIVQSTSKNGRRFSANLAYIRPIRNVRPNLKIIENAYVTKLIIDSATKTAQGVTAIINEKYVNFYAKKEVIVSAGSINSPKILMLSGIGPKEDLENLNIPVLANLKVGYNLQDHVTTEGLSFVFTQNITTNATEVLDLVTNFRAQDPYQSGPLSSTGTLNAVAFIKTKYAKVNAPDIQYHFDSRYVTEFNKDPLTYIPTYALPLHFGNGVGIRTLLLTPKSRGRIKLNETDPVFAQPSIHPRFFTAKEDLDTVIEGARFAITLEETEAFKRSGAYVDKTPIKGCEQYPWGSYDYLACIYIKYTAVIFHPVGTCKMGPTYDEDAVVDSRLLVYGIQNLRVVDGSIMPTIVRGNTNAPIIMIAEKTSDLIKKHWAFE